LSLGTFVIGTRSSLSVMNIERNFRNHTVTLLVLLLTITSGVYLAAKTVHRANALTSTPATFTNYELAGNQFTPDHSQGVACPNSNVDPAKKCFSTQAEPAIRADRDGNFYGSSESVFCVIGGQCGGTYAWKSADDGAHFTTLRLPNSVEVPTTPLAVSVAGGDTDIAVAPRRNSLTAAFNVYVVSLHSSLASVAVSTSSDGGNSWSTNLAAASAPVVDRPWIAADGANKVCISYHNIATTGSILVQCSLNGGNIFGPPISTIDANHLWLLDFNTQIGTLAIDPGSHVIYEVFSGLATESEGLQCLVSCSFGLHAVWAAVSTDGGNTFTDYPVFIDSNPQASTNHQFAQVSVDKGEVPYVVWSNDRNVYYSFSADFGKHWLSPPVQVNKNPSNTAIFPWSAAGNAGQLDIVWYGSLFTSAGGPATFPHYTATNPDTSASWQVYFAQNVQATTNPSSFTQVAASGTIHFGDVCEGGIGCGGNNNRDLLDDFGVAASPTTGNAAIIYTSDQYVNTQLEPANTYGSRHCASNPPGQPTSPAENTVDCSHTDIAIQTGGSTVNQHPGNFEEDSEDFEETNVSGSGVPQPHEEIDLTNTGTVAINTFSVAIGGLPWTLTWSSTSPIQPGQSVRATSNSVPLGLVLAVGTIYTLTITATMANGTTETHTINAIYTLGAGLGL
jgi:hypothetical protein